MLRYSSGLTVTHTKPRQPQSKRKANICRLRLTLPPEENWPPWGGTNSAEKTPKQLYQAPSGLSAGDLKHGVVYGVVHRSDDNHNKEMVVYGWSAHQLKEEMRYIRDVRLTLERVRNKMYGEYDEMKRKIHELSSELTVSTVAAEQRTSSSPLLALLCPCWGLMLRLHFLPNWCFLSVVGSLRSCSLLIPAEVVFLISLSQETLLHWPRSAHVFYGAIYKYVFMESMDRLCCTILYTPMAFPCASSGWGTPSSVAWHSLAWLADFCFAYLQAVLLFFEMPRRHLCSKSPIWSSRTGVSSHIFC
uniref:Myocardial zonula adherens protein n=1 Tax=Laticauda laticaudata TaxID=8630 RepID=A0A8C5SUX1_LATLA